MRLSIKGLSVILSVVAWAGATQAAVTEKQVIEHYADLAHAVYSDALSTAKTLQAATMALTDAPSAARLQAAREAWIAARVPYQQSEAFRFGNPVVDEWEGQLNAWPLDEGLIDYVNPEFYAAELGNEGARANIIASTQLNTGTTTIDLTHLNAPLLASLNELGGSEANVATGYHAIEFLLWGQDLNGTGPGAGERPYTDFVSGEGCTHGHCARRGAYLNAAADLLVQDLAYMVMEWQPGKASNYRAQLLAEPASVGLQRMLYSIGSLSLGELAGERMKVALEAGSTEDEHDCFSDNTHYSHYYNGLGIRNVYNGEYQRIDGHWLRGPSLYQLVAQAKPKVADTTQAQMNTTQERLQILVDRAENGQRFDQMIAFDNSEGRAIIEAAIAALAVQTGGIEASAAALGIQSLNPDTANHSF